MVKYNKLFRILTLAVIFSLLMLTITATPVLAAESLSVSPTKVEIGDTISVTGSGYTAGGTVHIFIASEELAVGDDIDDLEDLEKNYYRTTTTALTEPAEDVGKISKSIVVPDVLDDNTDVEDEEVHPGTYYVYTTYSATGNVEAMDDFIVRGIELDVSEGPVGTEVEITGSGFDAREDITIEYDGGDVDIASGDEETDSYGEFTCTITIPESIKGDHTITAVDESYHEGEAEFTVEPALTINPTSGKVGDSVTVNGTGFGNKKDVTITFDDDEVDITGDDETSNKGSFEVSFNVPSVGPGTYDVAAEDTSHNSASAQFRITTSISLSASSGHVGSAITINGTGFKANWPITITYASEIIFEDTVPSEADGSFEYILTVPKSTHGTHTITASDGTNSTQATFTMESTSPLIPQPLLPYMDTKASSKAYFDWEDVTDDSLPVTYDLQVATDANFTTILVDKTGLTTLTTSEYTLTDEEKLESTSKEEPYYWHVRAVDAASNASGWTGAGTFYVGFIFPFPEIELKGWVLYAVLGAGALLLFFLGFWVGRKSKGGGAEEYEKY